MIEVPRSGTSGEREDGAGGMMGWLVQSSCFALL